MPSIESSGVEPHVIAAAHDVGVTGYDCHTLYGEFEVPIGDDVTMASNLPTDELTLSSEGK